MPAGPLTDDEAGAHWLCLAHDEPRFDLRFRDGTPNRSCNLRPIG